MRAIMEIAGELRRLSPVPLEPPKAHRPRSAA
jgi:hypothetical protein